MSSGVDQQPQRIKGQGGTVNGPKESGTNNEFDGYYDPQSYSVATNGMPEYGPYSANYGYFSYPPGGVSEASWSTGDPATSFLPPYAAEQAPQYHMPAQSDSAYANAAAGQNPYYSPPGWGYFNGQDYNNWGQSGAGNSATPQRSKSGLVDSYGEPNYYGTQVDMRNSYVEGSANDVQQGISALSVGDKRGDVTNMANSIGNVKDRAILDEHSPPPQVTSSVPKARTWANIASQPARAQPKPIKLKGIPPSPLTFSSASSAKHNMDSIGTWGENKKSVSPARQWLAPRSGRSMAGSAATTPASSTFTSADSDISPPPAAVAPPAPPPPVSSSTMSAATNVECPIVQHSPPARPSLSTDSDDTYNPKNFELNPRNARFFIIKSYSEDDIHRSIKYKIWCSTEHGNKRLDSAFKERERILGTVFLFYSVNGSGHFCGMAQMTTAVDYGTDSKVWAQDKWKGQFGVKWIYVKDVPNSQLRHIRLENNENKPVTNSRDTQEVPQDKGKQVLKIMHNYKHSTSIFDDYQHYEKRMTDDDPGMSSAATSAVASRGARNHK